MEYFARSSLLHRIATDLWHGNVTIDFIPSPNRAYPAQLPGSVAARLQSPHHTTPNNPLPCCAPPTHPLPTTLSEKHTSSRGEFADVVNVGWLTRRLTSLHTHVHHPPTNGLRSWYCSLVSFRFHCLNYTLGVFLCSSCMRVRLIPT